MDECGLIRLQGRFDNAVQFDEYFKKSIVLNKRYRFINNCIQYYHQKEVHQGRQTTVNNLREKYWMIDIRNAVKKIIRNYQRSKKKIMTTL